MKLSIFNGGLDTALDAHLIQPNQSVVYSNVDNAKGTLTPLKDKLIGNSIFAAKLYNYFFTAGNLWVSSNLPTSWAEFQERLYWTNENGNFKLQGASEFNIGIDSPEGAITLTVTNAPNPNTRASISLTASGNLPTTGSFNYRFVNEDTVTGLIASSDIVLTSPTEAIGANNTVRLGNVDTNFANRVGVYREFDGFWRFVNNLNTAGSFINDAVYDISANAELQNPDKINGTIQYALTYYNVNDGTESAPLVSDEIVVQNGTVSLSTLPVSSDPQVTGRRLYRIGGNLTSFTRVIDLDNTVTAYLDELADNELEGSLLTSQNNNTPPIGMKFLTEYSAMLVGAVGDKLYFTPIGVPTSWPALNFLDFPTEITGIAVTAGGLLVLTQFKSYLVTGTGPSSLAQQLLSGDQGCVSHFAIVSRTTFAVWVSSDGVCTSDGGNVELITKDRLDKLSLSPVNAVMYDQEYLVHLNDGTTFAVDFARNIFQYMAFGIQSLVVANDILYGYNEGLLYKLLASTENLSLEYKSPIFVLDGYTQPKVYKKLYISFNGSTTVSVFIDDELVASKTFVGNGTEELKFPKDSTRGHSIQFHVKGTGIVREIVFGESNANA